MAELAGFTPLRTHIICAPFSPVGSKQPEWFPVDLAAYSDHSLFFQAKWGLKRGGGQ